MKMTKRIQAIWDDIAATPNNPKAPAISAMIKKNKASRNMMASFLCHCCAGSGERGAFDSFLSVPRERETPLAFSMVEKKAQRYLSDLSGGFYSLSFSVFFDRRSSIIRGVGNGLFP
jgi:hypothetical protein